VEREAYFAIGMSRQKILSGKDMKTVVRREVSVRSPR
jgi:hypothetical protein